MEAPSCHSPSRPGTVFPSGGLRMAAILTASWFPVSSPSPAADGKSGPDSAHDPVPAPVTVAEFTALLERPPFRRMLSLPDTLVLSGVATLPEGKMVTVWNRTTRESFIVTSAPNPQGWRLEEVTGSADLKTVAAVISAGGQSVTLRFDPARLTPPKLDNNSKPGRRTESQVVVEALLQMLDPAAARSFEKLPPGAQEQFRKSLAGYLGTYPAASPVQRADFVRRTLDEVSAESPDEAATASPAPGSPSGNPAPGSAPAPAPSPAPALPPPPLSGTPLTFPAPSPQAPD